MNGLRTAWSSMETISRHCNFTTTPGTSNGALTTSVSQSYQTLWYFSSSTKSSLSLTFRTSILFSDVSWWFENVGDDSVNARTMVTWRCVLHLLLLLQQGSWMAGARRMVVTGELIVVGCASARIWSRWCEVGGPVTCLLGVMAKKSVFLYETDYKIRFMIFRNKFCGLCIQFHNFQKRILRSVFYLIYFLINYIKEKL